MISVGLTGNIGSGKTTVARMFADLGAEIVDADAVVHELLAPGGAAEAAVLAEFPESRSPEGSVDRAALARAVFANAARRRELERLLHPLVVARSEQLVEAARRRGSALAITEATLLFEAWKAGTTPDPRKRFDAVVVVTCDEATRRERLERRERERGGATPDEQERRHAAQMPQDEKAALADHVVDTSGSLQETAERVRMVHSALLRAAPRG